MNACVRHTVIQTMLNIGAPGEGSQGRNPPVLIVGPTKHFGTRRLRFVAGWLAGLIALLALAVVFSTHPALSPIEVLTDILCCDGCCRASATEQKLSQSNQPKATILHLSGSTEIDYTRNGHRVPLHMESALNELDHIARHVKLGLPKYLQESAAQREADLVNHKFVRDLEGVDDEHTGLSHHHKSIAASLNTAPHASSGTANTIHQATSIQSRSSIVRAVAEASRMEEQLRSKDKEEEGKIIAPSARELSRDESDAVHEASTVGSSTK